MSDKRQELVDAIWEWQKSHLDFMYSKVKSERNSYFWADEFRNYLTVEILNDQTEN